MNNPQKYIISLDSMTHAQKAKTLLAVNGYSAEVARAPGSCGFGVSVYGKKDELSALLAAAGLRIKEIKAL